MKRHVVGPTYLLICLLLGGASAAGIIANLLLELAALPLIGWALWVLLQAKPVRAIRTPLVLLALVVALPLLSLVPLPPALWTLLPGREFVAADYHLLGIDLPWLPISLAPASTLAALLWLLPAFAAFLSVTVLGAFRARWFAWTITMVTLASIAVGALQIVGGGDSPAYFYDITNPGVAVGFFANGNHNATLLLVCIPFLAALQVSLLKRGRSARSASAIHLIVGATYAVLLVGLLINASLAGIGLGVPVTLGTWLVFGRLRAPLRRGLVVLTALASAAALVLIVVGPFGNNLFGLQQQNVELSRQTSFALTWRAAKEYLPFGSGIGSFQPIYRTQEPLSSVTTTYMNHAHGDWLELLLETGVTGFVLAGLFLVWWVGRVRAVWRAEEPDPFARAAAIAMAAIMLHSLVDYPLRTAALSAVFAICIGLVSGVRPYVRTQRNAKVARHLSL